MNLVDTSSHFASATVKESAGKSYGLDADGIQKAPMNTWSTMYTGFPNILTPVKDQSSPQRIENVSH